MLTDDHQFIQGLLIFPGENKRDNFVRVPLSTIFQGNLGGFFSIDSEGKFLRLSAAAFHVFYGSNFGRLVSKLSGRR